MTIEEKKKRLPVGADAVSSLRIWKIGSYEAAWPTCLYIDPLMSSVAVWKPLNQAEVFDLLKNVFLLLEMKINSKLKIRRGKNVWNKEVFTM
jgi:hypothetical protein